MSKRKKDEPKGEKSKLHEIYAVRVYRKGVVYLQVVKDFKPKMNLVKAEKMVDRDMPPAAPHASGICSRLQGNNNGNVSRAFIRQIHLESRREHPLYRSLPKTRQPMPTDDYLDDLNHVD